MLLSSVEITGFRSFQKPVNIFISPRTTVLIGPNDHGKTNVLLSIGKIDPTNEFSPTEVNHRVTHAGATLTYRFQLSPAEITRLGTDIGTLLEQESESDGGSEPTDNVIARLAGMTKNDKSRTALRTLWDQITNSGTVGFVRAVGQPLELKSDAISEKTRAAFLKLLLPMMPKVFLFAEESLRQLPDTVNLASLETNEVMQGVFRLAGIWDRRERLLSGNTRQNQDDLREASETLTTQIRKNWTQGRDLEFHLEYVGNDIRLTVKDTARTVTAVGDRSNGFTAYFAMRMLLVARTDQAAPNGYIFMFDEPGLNLHPKGQVDLQNVFEDIASTNQIIYSTHSVFLINKNYPDRNHLVYKDHTGSNIDNKPFVGGWAKVKEHLGLYLSANFLFTDRVLLAEGSTDEIYVPLILQGLIARGRFSGDLNAFAMRGALNSKDMLAVASIYAQEQRSVTVLVDGDEEGRQREAKIHAWAKRAKQECPVIILSDYKKAPCSIEDFLEPIEYRNATLEACRHAVEAGYLQRPSDANWSDRLTTLLDTPDGKDGSEAKSLGKRVEAATREIFGESISDNSIAIRYSALVQRQQGQPEVASIERYWEDEALIKLANALWEALDLPALGDTSGTSFVG